MCIQKGSSCAEVVFCQKLLSSIVEKKQWSYSKMGVDMTAAFDNIMRNAIINLLWDCGCTEDEVRIVKSLISQTKLKVKLKSTTSKAFEVTLGSFQGDCLSAKLFTLYLAGALNHVRAVSSLPNPPIQTNSMPSESQYADDCEFFNENEAFLKEQLFPKIKETFQQWNLRINESKTEYTLVEISKNKDQRGKESWRELKVLGSKLGSNEDIRHKINMGCITFKYKGIWNEKKHLDKKTKIRLYEALVVPIMIYNSCTYYYSFMQLLKKILIN